MKLLSEPEFLATFEAPMRRLALDSPPPFDYWAYFDTISPNDFEGHDCSEGTMNYAWNDATGRYQHVLVNSESKGVFMVSSLICRMNSSLVTGF